jgi:hypothetical protein
MHKASGHEPKDSDQLGLQQSDEPEWLPELRQLAKPEWIQALQSPEGAAILTDALPKSLPVEKVATDGTPERRVWELIGLFLRAQRRWHDARAIYSSMYRAFLQEQVRTGLRIHKGMPLVWIADCYLALANLSLSKRHLMLTLIEDAITGSGRVDPTGTGSYFRLAWNHGLSGSEINRYAAEAYDLFTSDPMAAIFPEFVLQDLDRSWNVEIPSPNDMALYSANRIYIDYLIRQLGEGSGKALERLADYVLSCVPGCITARRRRSYSTDYDIVCSIQGPDVDFRSDFGRYFVCECKDWEDPADFSAFAKFTRVLDSIKARFGVIFSRQGISGEASSEFAKREQLKVFQDRGLVIAVIDYNDLKHLANGANLVAMLREKYEAIRLDLRP